MLPRELAMLAHANSAGPWLPLHNPSEPGHRRHRPGTAQRQQPADPVAGRRVRAPAAGGLPAACHLAGRLRSADRPARIPARRRDHLLPAAGRHRRHAGSRRGIRRGRPARRRGPVTRPWAAGPGSLPSKPSSTPPAPRRRSRRCCRPGVRHRQLRVRTLLTGMMLALDDRRPAYLTEVRAALIALPEADQIRLGVTEDWKPGPHQLTYRQTEHTCRLIAKALGKDQPDGAPSGDLQGACDNLLEASIPAAHKNASPALAADWTDVGDLVPAAPARQHRMRRPRGLVGTPQLQPARAQGRDVLRLLPAGRRHGRRGRRPRRPRAGPPDDPHQLPPGPGPRPGPGADRHARSRHPARRHHRRLRLRPP